MFTSKILFVHDLAVDHPHDPVGLAADADVVRDDQEGQVVLSVQLPHQGDDLVGVLAVEVAGRLVGPDDRGVVDERTGDRHALALAARELVGHVLGPVAQAHELERIERLAPRLLRRDAGDEQRQLDVLDRAQHGHQVVELEDEAHPARPVVGALAVGHLGERHALDQDVPAR